MNPLLSLLLAMAQCVILPSAAPTFSSLVPRTRYCTNIPGRVAGSWPSPHTRSLSPSSPRPLPRAPSYTYCVRGHTRTFVLITLSSIIPIEEPIVENLISSAMDEITNALKQLPTDGPIIGGVFTQIYEGVAMWITNSNNHQVTWGVLGTALVAIGDYFEEHGGWGALEFVVWDGDNEVAVGRIGVVE